MGKIRINQASTLVKKIYENVKDSDDIELSKDFENFMKKSEKLKNFKFL